MAINERLIHTAADAAGAGTENQGLILHLDANDVDSYDGDGTVWYDIKDYEYTPATNADEHFNTVLFTGDNASSRAITGVGFQPDLVWIKDREASKWHMVIDSVRGANKLLYPNETSSEYVASPTILHSFDSDGFTVGYRDQVNSVASNVSGQDYVAWCFKAGGAAVSNTDGTITSQVSANNDLGFSIVKYTGTTGADDVGHGLDVAPDLVIAKTRDSSDSNSNWIVYASPLSGQRGILNSDTSFSASTAHFRADPSSSVLKLSSNSSSNVNRNGEEHIAYCFASKRGVSKIGSYTGTGAAGNKVYTGFEPAFVMIKNENLGGWIMWDNQRGGNKSLFPFSNIAEITNTYDIDFNSDGFTIQSTNTPENQNGSKFIYLAFAKNTKETSLIPDTDLELHLDADSFPEYGEDGYSNTPSTWTDISGNSYNSTISNAQFDSELGNWLDFNGSNSVVTVPSSTITPINPTLSFSISLWVRHDDLTGHQTYLAKYGVSTSLQSFIFGLDDSTNKMRLIESTGSGFNIRLSSSTITSNSWTHIVVTSTSSAVKFYINGTLDATITRSQTRVTGGSQDITIGSRPSSVQPFNGQIGQTRMYSSALTEDEVRQNYNFTKNKYPNGYNGTITGATWNPSGYFDFDGSGDDINLGQDLSFNINSSISIWINPDSIGGNRGIISKWQGSTPYGWLLNKQNSGNIEFAFYSGSSFKIVNAGVVSTGVWSHIAITYDGNDLKAYLNGTLSNTTSNINGLIPNNNSTDVKLFPSAISGITTQQYDGKSSKLKMYDKALTQAEVTALYNEGE